MNQDQVHDLVPLTSSNWSSDLSVGSLGYPQNASPVASFIDVTDAGATTRQLVLGLSNGQTRTYTVSTGQRVSVQFSSIKSTTTIAACHVGFGAQVGGSNLALNFSGSLQTAQLRTLVLSSSLSGSGAASFKGTPVSLNGLESSFSFTGQFSAGSNLAGTGSIEASNDGVSYLQVTSPTDTRTIFSGSTQADNGIPMGVNFSDHNFRFVRFRYDRVAGSGSISENWANWRYA